MIDTIVLRIRNVKKYKRLYNQFYFTVVKKQMEVSGRILIDGDGVITGTSQETFRRIKFYEDSGKFIPDNINFDIYQPSYNYRIRGLIRNMDTDKAELEVEFSIPKYFHGTNVFQFVPDNSRDSYSNFLRLIKGIKRFMNDRFAQVPDDADVQIFRLDMCFNQFHNTQLSCYEYQKHQFEHTENYSKSKNFQFNRGNGYNWYINSTRYMFKCYHKGDEFKQHDYKELLKLKTKNPYDLSFLQKQADRILRYEIEFRNSMMNYLYMYYTFLDRDDVRAFSREDNCYKYIRHVQKLGNFKGLAAANGDKTNLSPVEFFTSKSKAFTLKSDFDGAFSPLCIFSESVTFGYSIYRMLYNFFWEKLKAVQPQEGKPVYKLLETIESYQARLKDRKEKGFVVKSGVKNGKILNAGSKHSARIISNVLLSQYMDLRQLKDVYPESTYKRLIRDVKAMGLSTKNNNLLTQIAPLDYTEDREVLRPIMKNRYI